MIYLKKLSFLLFTLTLSLIFIFQFSHKAEPEENPVPTVLNHLSSNKSCTFYKWFDPNTNDKEGKLLLKNCSSCHMAYYKEWTGDKHSMSQNNPFFLSIYNTYRLDHPNENGNCALCHNPEAVLSGRDAPLERLNDVDLRKIKSKKTNGISCDFCHKIESVDQNPIKKGVSGLNVLRICKGERDIRFGPLKDPIQPSDKEELKYNSLYKTSLSCAKCHDGSNRNVQIYSTSTEWSNSPAAKKGVQCQSCHMRPRQSHEIVDNPNVKHKTRPYYEIHSHSFLTENPHEFREKYVDLTVETRQWRVSMTDHGTLTVTCTVENKNFGHSFPTGSPMRNAILLVEAKDKDGNDLKLIKGSKLPNYAGDLKDKPGKLFAKILSETTSEYAVTHSKAGIKFRKIANELGIPAQDWWNVFVLNDTRIKANGNDISTYEFEVKAGLKPASTEITARLIWRNTWLGLAKIKGFKVKEDLLIEKKLLL